MDPRLGIYVPARVGVPFADRMTMIRDAGFGATCLWWEEEREESRRLRHLAPDIVRQIGLHIDNIHVPYRWCNALWSSDEDERSDAIARHLGWVEDCGHHEIQLLVMMQNPLRVFT